MKNISSFRLAVSLYADNNYVLRRGTVLRKVIENVFIHNNNSELSLFEVIRFVKDEYGLMLLLQEVKSIISSKNDFHVIEAQNNSDDETIISLSEKKYQTLKISKNINIIDDVIADFEVFFEKECGSSKEIIYKFLLDLLSENVDEFSKLLKISDRQDILIKRENGLTQDGKKIITDFLTWDNDKKNKALFDVASYAIEYCSINGGKDLSLNFGDLIGKKIFYLDTNIVFRFLGINGENRKILTTDFIKKCQESGTSFYISKYTDKEFRQTIDYYTRQIDRFNSEVNMVPLGEFTNNYDIYTFFHSWRRGRVNCDLRLFKQYVFSLYDSALGGLGINIDYVGIKDENENSVNRMVTRYRDEIIEYKSNNSRDVFGDSALYDAQNVYLVEKKRTTSNTSIIDTKQFIISTDSYLCGWDYQRDKTVSLILQPNQWLSLLLRYVQRSTNDYKSFVSFLNMPSNMPIISNEDIHLIICGVSELTDDISKQKVIVKNFIETEAREIFEGNDSLGALENIKSKTKSYLKDEFDGISEKVQIIEKINQQALEENQVKEKKLHEAQVNIEQSNKKYTQIEKDIFEIQQENKDLRSNLSVMRAEKRVRKYMWNFKGLGWVFLLIFNVIFLFFIYFFQDWDYNFVKVIIDNLDGASETRRDIAVILIHLIIISLGFKASKKLITYYCKESIEKIRKNE